MASTITEVAHAINTDGSGTTEIDVGTRSGTEQWIIGAVGSLYSSNNTAITISDIEGETPALISNANDNGNGLTYALYEVSAAFSGSAITITHAPTTNIYACAFVMWAIEDMDETDTDVEYSSTDGVLDWTSTSYTAAANDGVVVIGFADDTDNPITIAGWDENGDSRVDFSASYPTFMHWGDRDALSSGSHTVEVDMGTGSSYGIAARMYIAASASAPSGTGTQTLDEFTQSATGAEEFAGTGAQTLSAFTQTASGVMQPDGSGAQTLSAFTQSASGVETFPGAGTQTLQEFTQSP